MLTDNELQRMRYQNESRKTHGRYRREVNLAYAKVNKYRKEMVKAQKENSEYRKVLREIPSSYKKSYECPNQKVEVEEFEEIQKNFFKTLDKTK